MSSPKVWDSLYSHGKNIAIAPYTEVFSFLARHFGPEARGKRLLEIGCGVGNNLAFARWAFGFDVFGIDHAETAVRIAKERFETHSLQFEHIGVGSVDSLDFDDGYFDAVIDRATIQHNTLTNCKKIAAEVHRVLKPGAYFYSSMTSDNHQLFGQGKWLGGGDFSNETNDGIRHFFSRGEVLETFASFEILRWYLVTRQELPSNVVSSSIHHLEMRKRE